MRIFRIWNLDKHFIALGIATAKGPYAMTHSSNIDQSYKANGNDWQWGKHKKIPTMLKSGWKLVVTEGTEMRHRTNIFISLNFVHKQNQ